MKIFVLTPIYATAPSADDGTPVVHYFTKEWVKQGHQVTVFHFPPKYLKPLYWFGRCFRHQINSRLGISIPTKSLTDEDYSADGVDVHRRCLKKTMPHSRYSKKQLDYALGLIEKECKKNGVPDWFVGHWDNPQLELLSALKDRYNKPTCLVFHGTDYDFKKKYGEEGLQMLERIDVKGFRSRVGQSNFINKYGQPEHTFVAASGVSSNFLQAGEDALHLIKHPIHRFVYVGMLINRKHPVAIIQALTEAYPKGDFSITYIGDGAEKARIEEEHRKIGGIGEVIFTGRIQRDEIIQHLKQADVFVMISQNETFGLVYLEAMALGLIPIGSKNEGIDGVIMDGVNGFLCKPGDVGELTQILKKIEGLNDEELHSISNNARKTANEYSDKGVAEKYLSALSI